MDEQERLDKGERERTPEEIEHFMERNRVVWAMATRTPVFFPSSSEDGVFGRPPERTDGRDASDGGEG